MRYSLRTLLVLMLLGGPLCAWGWQRWEAYRTDRGFDQRLTPGSSGLLYLYDPSTGDHYHPLTGERLHWNEIPQD